jgi:hypothetical protein
LYALAAKDDACRDRAPVREMMSYKAHGYRIAKTRGA